MSADGRTKSLKSIAALVGRLTSEIVQKEAELARRETSIGTYHDVQKINRLREDIGLLERRLRRAEIAQDMEIRNAQ